MIDVGDCKPNSHKSKAEQQNALPEKRVEKVVTGNVRKKKKNELRKFKDAIFSEDASNVGTHIFSDVLIPAIKRAIFDSITDGVNMILYGESGGDKRRSQSEKISYRDYYGREKDRKSSRRTNYRFDFDDLIFDTYKEAEDVLEQMEAIIERYGFVTVSDMYDMADLTAPYTAERYGWANLDSTRVARIADGYILKLPKAMPIER